MLLVAAETTLRSGRNRQTVKLLEKAERARSTAASDLDETQKPSTIGGSMRCASMGDKRIESPSMLGDRARVGSPHRGHKRWRGLRPALVSRASHWVRWWRPAAAWSKRWRACHRGSDVGSGQRLAGARLSRGDVEGAHRLWTELQELGREMGAGAVHARSMVGLGQIHFVQGRLVQGRDVLENAVFRLRDQAAPCAPRPRCASLS